MDWGSYGAFVVFAVLLVLVPGPDLAVVAKNTLAGGRQRGGWAGAGVASSNAVQGAAAALGLGAVILRTQPLFEAIRWAGVAYLAYLGVQALRDAIRPRTPAPDRSAADRPPNGREVALGGWRQGFLSNITNPKVLAFYLAVLPQFLTADATVVQVLALAVTHAVLSLLYLQVVVAVLARGRQWLQRRPVRRTLDAVTGTVLVGFSAKLATESR
jgi:threonine/homoserine/homoserine lactone efflux protein